jgi:hypothetical protein
MEKRCSDFDLDLTFETFKTSLETKGDVGYCSMDDVLEVPKIVPILIYYNFQIFVQTCPLMCVPLHALSTTMET